MWLFTQHFYSLNLNNLISEIFAQLKSAETYRTVICSLYIIKQTGVFCVDEAGFLSEADFLRTGHIYCQLNTSGIYFHMYSNALDITETGFYSKEIQYTCYCVYQLPAIAMVIIQSIK